MNAQGRFHNPPPEMVQKKVVSKCSTTALKMVRPSVSSRSTWITAGVGKQQKATCHHTVGAKAKYGQQATWKYRFFIEAIFNALMLLANTTIQNFTSSGLPWTGGQCRSLRAGASGILLALCALVVDTVFERALWIIQGVLSVTADYACICGDSYMHGVDRVFSICNVLRMMSITVTTLRAWVGMLTIPLPCLCFVLASMAKKKNNIERWKWCHFAWHLSSLISCFVVCWLVTQCSTGGSSTTNHSPFMLTLLEFTC